MVEHYYTLSVHNHKDSRGRICLGPAYFKWTAISCLFNMPNGLSSNIFELIITLNEWMDGFYAQKIQKDTKPLVMEHVNKEYCYKIYTRDTLRILL